MQFYNRIITFSFYALFFFVPLILTPFNYELFEYNKMMLVYGLTIIIASFWFIKMITIRKLQIQRTPLDIPILLFLLSQVVATFFSIDPHLSIWGYYSRFNGGLLSIASYIILYYALVTNFSEASKFQNPKKLDQLKIRSSRIYKLLLVVLFSAALVSIYGILERFGIDKNLWVQDVQNRVFSTLGQPNWLAAYLCILLPIAIALSLNSKSESRNSKPASPAGSAGGQALNSKHQIQKKFRILDFDNWNLFGIYNWKFGILTLLFYLCLLFTKSRSGFLAFWLTYPFFWFLAFLIQKKSIIKHFMLYSLFFILITFFVGSPFGQINKLSFAEIFKTKKAPLPTASPSAALIQQPSLDTGVTESGEIRRIVWKGAIDIVRHFPLFGTGLETFAFSYYQYKPIEHNLTSEWDFLYNKAHNEFLNYAANTGLFGLGSYLLLIITFVLWSLKSLFAYSFRFARIREDSRGSGDKSGNSSILLAALLSGFLSILITNFFGFSIVIVNLFFFLLPAFAFVMSGSLDPKNKITIPLPLLKNQKLQHFFKVATLLVAVLFIFRLAMLWWADTLFARGKNLLSSNEVTESFQALNKAVFLNQDEPLYKGQLSLSLAKLSVLSAIQDESTAAAQLEKDAIKQSDQAITISPANVNLWKERTRVFYYLSAIKGEYTQNAIESLSIAAKLSPFDPKIFYNLGLLYGNLGEQEKAMENLKTAIELKPNYRDPYFALALFYKQEGKIEEAKKNLQFILEKINSDDKEVQDQLESL